MLKLVKLVAIVALIGGAIAVMPGSAEARGRGGGAHFSGGHFGGGARFGGGHFGGARFGGRHFGGGHFRRGIYGWGGLGLGSTIILGWGSPYYYADWPYFYEEPTCGWVRVWRHHRRYRVWRCW